MQMHLYNNTMLLPNETHPCQTQTPLEFGLKALTLDPKKNPPHKNYSTMLSDLLSPTSSSLLSGDYIGMESSVDVLKDFDDENNQVLLNLSGDGKNGNFSQRLRSKREQKWALKNKEFPPPIPLLARTENLPSHMPWVLKRHYTRDGRLILTEEKVRHHEYFRAHRSNGRLTLQLVPLDDEVLIPSFVCDGKKDGKGNGDENVCEFECDDQDQNFDDHDDSEGGCDDGGDHDDGLYDIVDEDDDVVEDPSISGIGGSAGKCFSFNSVITGSPCILGVPVPAIRHVHS